MMAFGHLPLLSTCFSSRSPSTKVVFLHTCLLLHISVSHLGFLIGLGHDLHALDGGAIISLNYLTSFPKSLSKFAAK